MEAFPVLDRRTGERVELDVRLSARVPASPVAARILDLSHVGCRVALSNLHLEPGATITLEIANGDRVSGEVVWSRASEAGVRFHRRLKSGTAVTLGIEQAPEPVAPIEPEPQQAEGGLISHWYRRLSGAFSARAGGS